MIKCWAETIGGCSNVQSREHYLSKGLWKGNTITVQGLWSEERTVGLEALTVKALCQTHNTLLSALDSEAKHIFNIIGEVYRLQDVRVSLPPSNFWNIRRYRVKGNLFERWAAKCLIGLFCAFGKDSYWHDTHNAPIQPPEKLVRAVYGLEEFKKPHGLYLAFEVGDRHYFKEGVGIETLFYPKGGFVGANLRFKGYQFLIWLSDVQPDKFNIESSSGTLFGPDGADLMYRPIDSRFTIRNVLSQVLTFEWDS